MFGLNDSITHGGPGIILLLISFIITAYAILASGALRFGRECDYRDLIIANLTKANNELQAANAELIEANRQQAQSSQAALELIRNELLPRMSRTRGV